MRQPPIKVEPPPLRFPVTDDLLDAPWSAVLFIEEHQGVYERIGDEWVCLDPNVSFVRPGTYVMWNLDGEEVDVEVPRCESRKYEHGRVKCRCEKVAGHPGETATYGGHWNLGAGRRW